MDGKDCRKRHAATTSPMQDGPITDRARQRSSLFPSDKAGPRPWSNPTVETRKLKRRPLPLSTNPTKRSSPTAKPRRIPLVGGRSQTYSSEQPSNYGNETTRQLRPTSPFIGSTASLPGQSADTIIQGRALAQTLIGRWASVSGDSPSPYALCRLPYPSRALGIRASMGRPLGKSPRQIRSAY